MFQQVTFFHTKSYFVCMKPLAKSRCSEDAPRKLQNAPRVFRERSESDPNSSVLQEYSENNTRMLRECSEIARRMLGDCSESAPRVIRECSECAEIYSEKAAPRVPEKAPRVLREGCSERVPRRLRESSEIFRESCKAPRVPRECPEEAPKRLRKCSENFPRMPRGC